MPTEPAITPQITQLLGPLLANHERIERYRAVAIKRATGVRGRTARRAAPRTSAFRELRRQLEEYAFYPAHEPRQAGHAKHLDQDVSRRPTLILSRLEPKLPQYRPSLRDS